MLMQIEYVLALEVAQAFLAPEEEVALCCFDVGHERGEILDPCIVSITIVVVGVICASRVPIEKIDRVWVWFVRDIDRVSSFPFIVPEGEEVDAEFEFVFDGGYLVVFDRLFDCIEAFFGEELFVPAGTLWIFGARVKGGEHCISKTSIVSVLDVDDCLLLEKKGWELAELKTRERMVLSQL